MATLLLIEDNRQYAASLRVNLEVEGFSVDVAHDGVAGLNRVTASPPALVILDLMLPGKDGYEVLRSIRSLGIDVPVVVLTARGDEPDKLRGFGLGADDYVTKPVGVNELIARVRAVLRRSRPGAETPAPSIRFGDVEVFPSTRSVKRAGQAVGLRPKEYDLLLALLRHQGRFISRAELLRDVWGYHAETISRTVDTHLSALRTKLEPDPLHPRYFITVRSAGYMFQSPDEEDS
jgi:DNA-binding response OmpR family regulator